MEYRANFTTKTCEKRFLNDTFRPFSIPFDAKYIDTVEIGSNLGPGDGVEVYVWGGQTPGRPHCKPINAVIWTCPRISHTCTT